MASKARYLLDFWLDFLVRADNISKDNTEIITKSDQISANTKKELKEKMNKTNAEKIYTDNVVVISPLVEKVIGDVQSGRTKARGSKRNQTPQRTIEGQER